VPGEYDVAGADVGGVGQHGFACGMAGGGEAVSACALVQLGHQLASRPNQQSIASELTVGLPGTVGLLRCCAGVAEVGCAGSRRRTRRLRCRPDGRRGSWPPPASRRSDANGSARPRRPDQRRTGGQLASAYVMLASEGSSYITGAPLAVSGKIHALTTSWQVLAVKLRSTTLKCAPARHRAPLTLAPDQSLQR
jgi:hypothetical protein